MDRQRLDRHVPGKAARRRHALARRRRRLRRQSSREGYALILLDLAAHDLQPIVEVQSTDAASDELARGAGTAHVHLVHIAAGGEIGRHRAGFGQLFVCLEGEGWVASDDGVQVPIRRGHAAYFRRGEYHAKGSAVGLRALIVQVYDLELCGAALDDR